MMRVLLVTEADDGEALAAALAALRPAWRFELRSDPAAALAATRDTPFDVVAVAWRVERSFGPELLKRLKLTCPEAMRLLLLPGRVDASEAARQTLATAHQALPLPLEPQRFVLAAERLLAVRWLLRDPTLRRLIGSAERLPSPPRLYLELTRAIGDERTGLGDVSRIIGQDPGIVTRVLRVANSALFSRGGGALDLGAAVGRLGVNVLGQIVLACEAYGPGVRAGIDVDALRTRAIQSGKLAARLVEDADQASTAATAALLADCVCLLPSAVLKQPLEATGMPRLWAGLPTESIAAAYLLGLWGLPHALVEAVAFCRDPGRLLAAERGFGAAGAVHVARALLAGEEPDASYVAAAGIAPALEGWRRLAAEIVGQGAARAAPSAGAGAERTAALRR
jgi:HD-like signal output (HDOD) protein